MTEKHEARFEEAERRKYFILASIAIVCSLLIWLVQSCPITLTLMSLLSIYLLTGDRYQWVYIWRKTYYRDLIGVRVLLATMSRVWIWERKGTTVVTRWDEVAKKNPDKKAFIMGDRALTFREGDELTNRIAWYFKRQGFKTGEVIALFMETQPEYVFIWLGLAKLRVITALVNTNLRGAQLVYCLKIVGCKAVVFGDELSGAIKEVQNELADIPLFQYNSPERETAPIIQDTTPLAIELNAISPEPFTDVAPAKPRDTLMYIYTSGTTGFPKAAIVTHTRFLLIPLGVHNSARLSSSDIIYDPLPLHHTAGGVLGAGQCLILGCTVVLRKKFSASNYWSDIAKYRCTVAQYIGEICRYLLAVAPSPIDRGHNLRVMAGNGLRPQIWQEFVERFGVKRVVEFYGATEGNSNLDLDSFKKIVQDPIVVTFNSTIISGKKGTKFVVDNEADSLLDVNLDSKVGAIGFLSRLVSSIYPLTLVKCDEITGEILRNEKGNCITCGPHEPGLLLGKIDAKKAILTFAGYADKTESEKKMVRNVRVTGDCYFNTGDILIMDHFGYFYFKDRTGDTFRWRGENVSTAEVEGVISNLVGLKDTIVYGVSIPHVEGKAGMAAIADPERKLNFEELAKGLNSSLPMYARPLFIRILPEPPLTVTFKLKKKDLLEQGYKINVHNDPIYFLDQKSKAYVPLTEKIFDDLMQGNIRL